MTYERFHLTLMSDDLIFQSLGYHNDHMRMLLMMRLSPPGLELRQLTPSEQRERAREETFHLSGSSERGERIKGSTKYCPVTLIQLQMA